jgi:dienelactone hydrolase
VLVNGVTGQPVALPSHSPIDYGPLIRGELGAPVTLTAQLFMPQGATGDIPVVIIIPGSGNLAPNYFQHAATLTSNGIAAFVVDPFTGRGVVNTIANQDQFSFAASAYDTFAAVKWLRTKKGIDGRRIGATGGSRGGTAVMMAFSAPLSDAVLGRGQGLRAVLAGYPWCGVQFYSARLADRGAFLILQGDHDNYVSPIQCQDAAHAMTVLGQDVVMELVPGARHSFDRAGVAPTELPDAVKTVRLPTVYMDDSGAYYDPTTGRVDPKLTKAQLTEWAIKGGFADKGATIGSEGTQAEDYDRELLSFFKSKL